MIRLFKGGSWGIMGFLGEITPLKFFQNFQPDGVIEAEWCVPVDF